MSTLSKNQILQVRDLSVHFEYDEGVVKALNGVNIDIHAGQSIGVVGESGCGKSVTSASILRILPDEAVIPSGEIQFRKRDGDIIDLTTYDAESEVLHAIRGAEISMVFQEPMTAFSPVHTIGNQIGESLRLHQHMDRKQAKERAVELLNLVGIPNPKQRVDEYSFQLSGGMRQRAMIAMALACNPRLLIADEPTTALDVTIQAQVLKLIRQMQEELDLSLMLITHDLGVIANMVSYVYVMYLGRVVEAAPVEELFRNPKHPYTKALLKSIPKVTGSQGKLYPIRGSVPDAYTLPSGCPFHTRCDELIGEICWTKTPRTEQVGDNHFVDCFHYTNEGT